MQHKILLFLFISSSCFSQTNVEKIKWIHGSEDCSKNKDPFAQVIEVEKDTYIIRQNKCLNYEAPFIYLFIGNREALLVDTGAKSPDGSFPLIAIVRNILEEKKNKTGKSFPLKVIHSHAHGDHKANDDQFRNLPDVELVEATMESLISFFQLKDWPQKSSPYDLGKREITIIPIPGHDKISIAIYDSQTKWLLTGDTVYPGRLYVADWVAFKTSIERLIEFANSHMVSFLMGNHIEMSDKGGVDYPTGTIFQPHEHRLPLNITILKEIRETFFNRMEAPTREVHSEFIIEAVK